MLEPLEAGGGGVPVIMGPVGAGAGAGVVVGLGLGAGGVGATFEVAVTRADPLA